MSTTEQTITEIENWYRDCNGDPIRPKLLCKLAFIEFCGAIEEWMDAAIRQIDMDSTKDSNWLESEVISRTYGFDYVKHFRPMACSLLGKHKVRLAEKRYSEKSGYDLDNLKSNLGSFWKKRCQYTHQDMPAHDAAQIVFDAPSWTKNQFRVTFKQLEALKQELLGQL